jgi:hypothetical protein
MERTPYIKLGPPSIADLSCSVNIMSRLSPMPMPVQNVPLKMPAASGSGSVSSRPTQSSRSSRRRIGSNGPPVLLGGGAGTLGASSRSSDGQSVSLSLLLVAERADS